MENLNTMMDLRRTKLIEECDEGIRKLWVWYCLELMRRVSRKDWAWGDDKKRKENRFSECVLQGDEAFVMANLESKIEHYCAIRSAKANNTYQKSKRGRVKGQKMEEAQSAKEIGLRYEYYREKMSELRILASEPLCQDNQESDSLLDNWDKYIQDAAAAESVGASGADKEVNKFNSMIFIADGPITY